MRARRVIACTLSVLNLAAGPMATGGGDTALRPSFHLHPQVQLILLETLRQILSRLAGLMVQVVPTPRVLAEVAVNSR